MNEWIKYSDKAPEEGSIILCLMSNEKPNVHSILHIEGQPILPQKVLIYSKLGRNGNFYFIDEFFSYYVCEYWMPLPEIPKD